MRIFEWVAVGILAALLVLAALVLRRALIVRSGGTIGMSLRLSTMVPGRGWAAGVGRFVGDELRWYRMFSLFPTARRVLSRREIGVGGRRRPDPKEQLVLPHDWSIVRCAHRNGDVEIAMAAGAVTGFLSWVEAQPPGTLTDRPQPDRANRRPQQPS